MSDHECQKWQGTYVVEALSKIKIPFHQDPPEHLPVLCSRCLPENETETETETIETDWSSFLGFPFKLSHCIKYPIYQRRFSCKSCEINLDKKATWRKPRSIWELIFRVRVASKSGLVCIQCLCVLNWHKGPGSVRIKLIQHCITYLTKVKLVARF